MLPVTHGMNFTGFHVWLYSIALAATAGMWVVAGAAFAVICVV